jgi:prepilin-type N-terminal cleavage/methylation domain-containing protein
MFKPRGRTQGFTLIELLVTLLISSVMMTIVMGFVQTAVATRQTGGAVTEAEQGLRALISVITQELRQAGACLPTTNRALAIQGTNNGTQDSLTLRLGRVDEDTTLCVNPVVVTTRTPPLAPLPSPAVGNTTVNVPDATLFRLGELLHITPNGAVGEYYRVAGTSGTTLTLSRPLQNVGVAYGPATQVIAIEERRYAVDTSNPSLPILTVAINQGAPQPLISGIDIFNVQYYLGPCTPTCVSLVNLPLTNQWQSVVEVAIKARVRSRMKDKAGNYQYVTTGRTGRGEYINIKPRNFL